MSTAMKSAEAIIRLDEARQATQQAVGPLGVVHEALSELLKRIQGAWDYVSEEDRDAFRKQAEKALAFDASLRDFRDYLNEPRAWAPAKEDI